MPTTGGAFEIVASHDTKTVIHGPDHMHYVYRHTSSLTVI